MEHSLQRCFDVRKCNLLPFNAVVYLYNKKITECFLQSIALKLVMHDKINSKRFPRIGSA